MKINDKGLTREQAYDLVQPLAIKAYNEKIAFKDCLNQSDEIKKYLSVEEIDQDFSLEFYFKNIDYIYTRVGII